VVLFFAVSPEPAHLCPFQLPVTCWAAWALVSLGAALDSSRLWRVLGRPVDPLGTQVLVGHVARGLEYRGFTAGGDVAQVALTHCV